MEDQTITELERTYAPFIRRDVYSGGKIPFSEIALLVIALFTVVPIRLIIGMWLISVYYIVCRLCTWFWDLDRCCLVGWRREVVVRVGRFLCRVFMFVLGFYWINEYYAILNEIKDEKRGFHEELERPGVIVSNHVSYFDILYHMSDSFPSFVAKVSVSKLPVVGLISKCLGCIFVQRETRTSELLGVSGLVTERIEEARLNRHCPIVMIFPEGTTTNGEYLLPFKTGAFLGGAPVLPIIIKYPYQRFSLAWESISGVPHAFLVLCQWINYMDVIKLPVYYPSENEKRNPKIYANNVRKIIACEGKLILSDSGLAEKRDYLAMLRGPMEADCIFPSTLIDNKEE
ncbi:hypothetical protein LUZ63_015783 [Rhynchospora breviuscula]|uniref:Phospholipid/glycerol acyltransferase domain-containing protein n=1 Tax=Rhynchospora breviuscula TaxID=2022672 RepID=A0A9Q0CCY5_9POAL|nr:hypothetical protein LUZ63_015783 [Rhynchospora breviuscula]